MISLSPSVIDATNAYLVHCGVSRLHSDTRVEAFYKAKIGNYSANYGRVCKRNSYTVLYKAGLEEFGMIQFFFTIPLLSMPLVIKRLEPVTLSSQDHFDVTDPAIGNIDHIPVEETGELYYGAYFMPEILP